MDTPDLLGWDDCRVHYWDGTKERCVSDHSELQT